MGKGKVGISALRRRVATFLSALSLALCVATAVVWVWSYMWQDGVRVSAGFLTTRVGFGGGQVAITAIIEAPSSSRRPNGHIVWDQRPGGAAITDAIDSDQPGQWAKLGFGYIWDSPTFGTRMFAIVVPCWFVLPVLAILPALTVRRILRRKHDSGSCGNCGYDLTGNTSGTCPECGTKTKGAAAYAPANEAM
jgi:hypothetical protein